MQKVSHNPLKATASLHAAGCMISRAHTTRCRHMQPSLHGTSRWQLSRPCRAHSSARCRATWVAMLWRGARLQQRRAIPLPARTINRAHASRVSRHNMTSSRLAASSQSQSGSARQGGCMRSNQQTAARRCRLHRRSGKPQISSNTMQRACVCRRLRRWANLSNLSSSSSSSHGCRMRGMALRTPLRPTLRWCASTMPATPCAATAMMWSEICRR